LTEKVARSGKKRDKFEALVDSWDRDMGGKSVTNFQHLSHFQIIGMGPSALGFMLERLRHGELRWLYAIKCVSGYEAETPAMSNDRKAIIEAWLEWGAANGILSR
jgi:hypothetical protein